MVPGVAVGRKPEPQMRKARVSWPGLAEDLDEIQSNRRRTLENIQNNFEIWPGAWGRVGRVGRAP